MDEIADGEIHILNAELAYILLRDRTGLYKWDVLKLKKMMFDKYFKYLQENRCEEGHFWWIERDNVYDQFRGYSSSSLALKFERKPNDTL